MNWRFHSSWAKLREFAVAKASTEDSDFSYRGEDDLDEISRSVCRPTSSIGRNVPVDLWVKFVIRWLMLTRSSDFFLTFSQFQTSSKDQPTRSSALRRRSQNSISRTIQRNSWVIRRLGCHFIKIIIIIISSALPKIRIWKCWYNVDWIASLGLIYIDIFATREFVDW